MLTKKVELLAPAGNYTCFQAALQAGADAIYLGGSKYGARAYADNFSEEEIVRAINTAHLLNRRIYLTVNTLVKNQELEGLVEYMRPYYEAGLDGVIIQDMGVFEILKEHFPGMELHASTQMTLTGVKGAAFLKEMGASRIVPARELSLDEIKEIKNNVDIEIETFCHGAMCYAYSGQCLFSSILGGRSGNRGRCAGPCRLPYECDSKSTKNKSGNNRLDQYPLSLKDMYTLRLLPELIEAGIDSLKIEGRMKSPEYVAGVTSIYRKYIDLYYANPDREYCISKEDERTITGLYIRSGLQEGYYHKHNGKEMITIQGPGYAGTDEKVVEQLKKQYVQTRIQLPLVAKCILKINEPASLLLAKNEEEMEKLLKDEPAIGVQVYGGIVQKAQNRPMTEDDIRKQLQKMGDTNFSMARLEIFMDENVFLAVKSLNELRRQGIQAYEEKVLYSSKRIYQANDDHAVDKGITDEVKKNTEWSVLVSNRKQFEYILKQKEISRVYIDADVFWNKDHFDKEYLESIHTVQKLFLALPYILRKRSYKFLLVYQEMLTFKKDDGDFLFDGVLIRNLEELSWLQEISYQGIKEADANLYMWNHKTVQFYAGFLQGMTLPVELNRKEKKHLLPSVHMNRMISEEIVYGRIPMMYTANCTKKTFDRCDGISSYDTLTDRYKNLFPVYHNCNHCYNVIYNTVPLSLHQYLEEIRKNGIDFMRLEFTNEKEKEMDYVLGTFLNAAKNDEKRAENHEKNSQSAYTTGHYKRGVE